MLWPIVVMVVTIGPFFAVLPVLSGDAKYEQVHAVGLPLSGFTT